MKKSVKPNKLMQVLNQPHYLALSIALLLFLMSSSAFAYKTFVMDKRLSSESSENETAGPIPWSDFKKEEKLAENAQQPTATTDQATASQSSTPQSAPQTRPQSAGQSEYERLKAELETTKILCTNPAIAANTAFMQKQETAVNQSYASRDAISYPSYSVEYAKAYNLVASYRNSTINAAYAAYTGEFQRLRNSGCDLGNPAYVKYPDWELISEE